MFTGLALPEGIRKETGALGGEMPEAKKIPRENLHITLRFIGEVEPEPAREIRQALRTVAGEGMTMRLKGVGSFPPRILWAGVEAPPELAQLKKAIDEVLKLFPVKADHRPFIPHVTIASSRKPLAARSLNRWIDAHKDFETEAFHVPVFVLFESRQEDGRQVYAPLETYGLG